MKNLKQLIISNNVNLHCDAIQNLTNLIYLNISSNNIINSSIDNLINLTYLDVSYCLNIDSNAFRNLKNIMYLNHIGCKNISIDIEKNPCIKKICC